MSETLTCDVVIVGSGAGGSVIAAECARAGKSVLVLEMGQYKNEQDFNQLEVQGYQEMYYGGGLAASESGSISVLAGSTLGGGTVVNYMNCIPTPARASSAFTQISRRVGSRSPEKSCPSGREGAPGAISRYCMSLTRSPKHESAIRSTGTGSVWASHT